MKTVTLLLLSIVGFQFAFAQPTLTISSPIVSDNSWQAYDDGTPPIPFGPGTGPNGGPGGTNLAWATVAGDNSISWSLASAVDIPHCLTPYGQSPIPGTSPIWSSRGSCSTGTQNQNDIVYLRRTFYANASQACQFRLFIKADNFTCIYINGHWVGGTNNNWGSGNTYDISGLITNGLNVVAVQVADDGVTGWMSLKISEVCPTININFITGAADCSHSFNCTAFDNPDDPNNGTEGAPGGELVHCCRYQFSTSGIDETAYTFKWTIDCCNATFGNCQNVHSSVGPTFLKDFPGTSVSSARKYIVCLTLTPNDGGPSLSTICLRFSYSYLTCGLTYYPFAGGGEDRDSRLAGSHKNEVQVYPNPFTNSFTIQNDNLNAGKFDISIFNELSIQVKTAQVNLPAGEKFQIQAEDLPKGVYRVLVQDMEGQRKPRFFNMIKAE